MIKNACYELNNIRVTLTVKVLILSQVLLIGSWIISLKSYCYN